MDEILESRLKRFPRFVLHFCPRKRHHHGITNTVFFLIFYIVPATLPSAFLTTHTNSGFIIDDRILAYFTRAHFRFYFFFHSLILLGIIFVIRRYPVRTSRRSFTPIPWMIMRKSICMMRILMIMITISDHFSFVIKPPALNFFPVYIQISSRICLSGFRQSTMSSVHDRHAAARNAASHSLYHLYLIYAFLIVNASLYSYISFPKRRNSCHFFVQ